LLGETPETINSALLVFLMVMMTIIITASWRIRTKITGVTVHQQIHLKWDQSQPRLILDF
jgi:hypothetical protein